MAAPLVGALLNVNVPADGLVSNTDDVTSTPFTMTCNDPAAYGYEVVNTVVEPSPVAVSVTDCPCTGVAGSSVDVNASVCPPQPDPLLLAVPEGLYEPDADDTILYATQCSGWKSVPAIASAISVQPAPGDTEHATSDVLSVTPPKISVRMPAVGVTEPAAIDVP